MKELTRNQMKNVMGGVAEWGEIWPEVDANGRCSWVTCVYPAPAPHSCFTMIVGRVGDCDNVC